MTDQHETHEQNDSVADAVAALVLIAIFVATCIYWVASQS